MSSARQTGDVPGYGWLLGMSSWMLLTLVPGPALAWLAFGIVGGVSRRPKVMILGLVAGVLAIVASLDIWGVWQPVVRSAVLLAGVVAALAVNPGWLRVMWARRIEKSASRRTAEMTVHRSKATAAELSGAGGGATAAGKPAARPAKRGARASRAARKSVNTRRSQAETPAAERSSDSATDAAAGLARDAGADTSDLLASPSGSSTPAAADQAEPVDVNTADADALATLPGVTRSRARKAVRERTDRGGFVSVEDFGQFLGLQPHEIVRLRRAATCSPRPRGERRFGRRVDF
jgi:DNA uptake protein ComE-like DNA-binding protein